MSNLQRHQLLLLAAACLPLAACSETFFHTPRLLHPGPAPYQRYKATQFDPYPPNDVAPDIVGGRPPDYTTPPNEVTRSRQYLSAAQATAQPVFTPSPVPTFPPIITGPPVITAPPGYVPPAVFTAPSASTAPPIKYRY